MDKATVILNNINHDDVLKDFLAMVCLQVALSRYEQDQFIDYDKQEHTLKIVKDRYAGYSDSVCVCVCVCVCVHGHDFKYLQTPDHVHQEIV